MTTLWNWLHRLAYCVAYPLFLIGVRLIGRDVAGCFVAVWHEDRLLLVHNSYRRSANVPGGLIEKGEEPAAAGARELFEEAGVRVPVEHLRHAFTLDRSTPRRQDLAWFFEVRLANEPETRVDGREVLDAAFVPRAEALADDLNPVVRRYLEKVPESGPDLPAV